MSTIGDWQGRAREAAQRGVEGAERFHLLGRAEKRQAAAEDAFTQLSQIQDGATRPLHNAVAVARAVAAAAADVPDARLAASRIGLQEIGARVSALAAGGSSALAQLAVQVIAKLDPLPVNREMLSDAAFQIIDQASHDPWVGFVGGLSDVSAVDRLAITGSPLEGGVQQAASAAAQHGKRVDGAAHHALVRHAVDRLTTLAGPEDHPVTALLATMSAKLPSQDADAALQAGIAHLGRGSTDVAGMTAQVFAELDDAQVAAVASDVLAALPTDGWGAAARQIVGGGPPDAAFRGPALRAFVDALAGDSGYDLDGLAAVASDLKTKLAEGAADPRLAESLRASMAAQAVKERSPHRKWLESVHELGTRAGLGEVAQLNAALWVLGQEEDAVKRKLTAQDVTVLASDLGASDCRAAILGEARALGVKQNDRVVVTVLDLLLATISTSTLPADDQDRILQTALERLADGEVKDVGGAAALTSQILSAMSSPEDALRAVPGAVTALQGLTRDPEQRAMLGLLEATSRLEPYEAATVLRGLLNGLSWMGEPSEGEGRALARFADAVTAEMNYWVDQSAVARLALDALASEAGRAGDPVLADVVAFVKRLDDEVDSGDEKERIGTLRAALSWLGETPTAGMPVASAIVQLVIAFREDTESKIRDIKAGAVAAKALSDVAARDKNIDLKHESAFLGFLADRRAENLEERHAALYAALEARQQAAGRGPSGLAGMAVAAMERYEPSQDRVRVAREALERIQASASDWGRAHVADAASLVRDWLKLPLYDEAARAAVADQLMPLFTEERPLDPGALAEAGAELLSTQRHESNQDLLADAFLGGIERLADAMGEKVYIPDLVARTRADMQRAENDDQWEDALSAGLTELAKFQGQSFTQAVTAGRVVDPTDAETPRIEHDADEVVIGGLKVPKREVD